MRCNLCKKECMENELINGICYDCLEKKYANKKIEKIILENEKSNEYNILANIILAIGFVIGIICGIGIYIQVKDMLNVFITILLSICTTGLIITNAWYKSLILSAEDEKIKLLKEINANNKK